LGKYYVIIPQTPFWKTDNFIKEFNAKPVAQGFKYNSGENDSWETVESLRALIKEHVDPTFSA